MRLSARQRRLYRPCLETLETRLLCKVGAGAVLATSPPPALLSFDAAAGCLTVDSVQVEVAFTDASTLAVTLDGQRFSNDPNDSAFAPALVGVNDRTLRELRQMGDGSADTLTLLALQVAGNLNIQTDGHLMVAGSVRSQGDLTVAAAALTVNGALDAADVNLTSAGLLNVNTGGCVTAHARGVIAMAADYLVNVGQVQVAGGSLTLNAANLLNAGTLSVAATAGAGGNLRVGFATSYVETATARTTADGETNGGWVTIDGGSAGRLFSSGQLAANGRSGGRIDLFGQSIALVAATITASGTDGDGGQLRLGGGYHGQETNVVNAQTVEVTATTQVQATGTGRGGRVVVWSQSQTDFTGSVSAQGTEAGGAIEVSSRGQLNYGGQANAGSGGQLLLDPANLVVSAAPTEVFPQFTLVNPQMDGTFGKQVLTLSTGNIVVTDPAAISNVGAVYLFNGITGALLSTLTGATGGTNGDQVGLNGVTVLTNGNYVVDSSAWNGAPGAVTWGSGVVGVSGLVSASNSLVGSNASDHVGLSGVTALPNGNYVVASPNWNGNKGAATWGSGTLGVSGIVSATNSLVGSNANDYVGGLESNNGFAFPTGVQALANGNYIVASPNWNGTKGAATWGSGMVGVSGVVSATNSLVGATANDQVGADGVTTLTNNNYVVDSPNWNNGLGAVTWSSGTAGVMGTISASNSLVGTSVGNGPIVGDEVGSGGVTALTNGNYVVASQNWNGGEGAATWGNGATGVMGMVSATNSLVGSSAGDQVGYGVTALTNGHYVVASPFWNGSKGAVTWGGGTLGVNGLVSATNSLVGTAVNDRVGYSGVTALTNGNYVVASPIWNGGKGAVTWGSGTLGVSGIVSATNSLVGSNANDLVGSLEIISGFLPTGVRALANGNYIVASPNWNGNKGAATWGSGMVGVSGVVSATNSLVGATANDRMGSDGVTTLTNGNYVVASPNWNGGLGAVTWSSGTAGVMGTLSASNSLVGSTAGDNVGGIPNGNNGFTNGVTALTNGNFVVVSPDWNGKKGAATWGNGAVAVSGMVSATNSLVGSNANDLVGYSGVTALTNGNYVVASPFWNGYKGAVTWGNGRVGSSGNVSATNSLVGSNAADYVGSLATNGFTYPTGVQALANGNYIVASSNWNGNKGAATWGDGNNGTTLDGQNTIDLQNSLEGTVANAGLNPLQAGTFPGSFLATFLTENGGVVTVGVSDPNQVISALDQGQTFTVPPDFLTHSLNEGTAVTLQASNNITINSPINTSPNNTTPLALQAGNGILLNAGINLGNGHLTLAANTVTALANVTLTGSALFLFGNVSTNNGSLTAQFPVVYLNGGSAPHTLVVTPSANQLTLNNQTLNLSGVTSLVAMGAAGYSAILNGTTGTNVFTATPTYSTLQGSNFTATVQGYSSVQANSTPNGNSTAILSTTNGADSFVGTPTYSQVNGSNYSNTAVGFTHVHGYAGGTSAIAYLVTSAGTNDILGGIPAYSFVQGSTYDSYAIGFAQVDGYSGGAGSIAYLGMSSGHDTFFGLPSYSAVTGTGYAIYAVGYQRTQGYSGGPNSSAILATSAGNDTYLGTPTYSSVSGSNYQAYALGFTTVAAYAGGGNSVAYLTTSSGNDSFARNANYSEATGTGYTNVAINFANVGVTAGSTNSVATFYDAPGTNTFTGSGASAVEVGPGYAVNGSGFGKVILHGTQGTDHFTLSNINYNVSHDGDWM